jgi:hypothetical protein
MKKMRPRLTFANVISCLALFVALGGSAYAATQLKKNSVGTKQLKKNAVTEAKVGNEAITAAKVKSGTLTGTQIDVSTLGTVPSAKNATSANNAANAINAQHAQIADSIQPPEALHLVGETGDPGVTFAPSWKNFAPPWADAAFYKDREGVVHLQGTVAGSGLFDEVFTLPPGYRPAASEAFVVGGNGGKVARVVVSGSGEVTAQPETIVSFDGVTFRAES